MTGIIVKALSGFYYLNSDGEIYECRAKGGFRKDGISPLVGDRAVFEPLDGGKGFITEILPRKNALQRPPVANIDKLFIISAFENPEPNTYIIDKITAIAEYLDIEPIIVFNKCDMGDFTEFEQIYKNSGFKTLTVSAVSKEGIDAVKDELKGCISAFKGNSGVGKSSIINAVMGNGAIATGEVSQKLGRGKHTTRHTELFSVGGGYVADTPGFSSLDYDTVDYGFKEKLIYSFPDLSKFEGCRFTSCTHTCEKGCGIIDAVESGKAEKTRFESYKALFNELKDLKPWNCGKKK